LKIQYHQHEKPDIDPVPKMEALLKKAAQMPDREFHRQISHIFQSQRDVHLSYIFPDIKSCYEFDTGIRLRKINEAGQTQVMVKYSLFVPAIKPGSIVSKVDGLDPKEYYQKHKWEVGGANDHSGFVNALDYMTIRSGILSDVPKKDFVDFELEAPGNKSVTKVQVPWFAFTNATCLDTFKQATQKAKKKGSHLGSLKNVQKRKRESVSQHLEKRQLLPRNPDLSYSKCL
jgi:hypothetical protein